jgi:serine phosphatase RsbU (regulator of sigma subunit)
MPIKKNRIIISIRVKKYFVIGLMLILFLAGFIIFKNVSKRQTKLNTLSYQIEIKESVLAVLETRAEFLEKISYDYCCYDWLIGFIQSPASQDPYQGITPAEVLGIDFMQIFNLNKEEVLLSASPKNINFSIDYSQSFFTDLHSKRLLHFYQFTQNGLFRIVASTVHPSDDLGKKTGPRGYLIVGKLYDSLAIGSIEKSLNCDISITKDSVITESENKVFIPIHAIDNKLIGNFVVEKHSFYEHSIKSFNIFFQWFFGIFFIILFLILFISYNTIILRPIGILQQSLNQHSEKIARKLMYKHDEFGMIARLIIRFFYQQKSLSDKIDKLSQNQEEMREMNSMLQLQKEELETTANSLIDANNAIQLQKKMLTDNIYYASIIQHAAFIPSFDIDKVFKEHFIIFKPRDIVSGDFYWFKHHKGKYLVAAADCTGHGLSGSLMSMLGISFLNQILLQIDTEDYTAAGILQLLRTFVVESLHQKGQNTEVHDGMDIILCIFDFNKMELEFASAFNSLLVVNQSQESDTFYDVTVYKGDHIPVGVYVLNQDFTNHVIPIQRGDMYYMFTDGIIDQFGGPNDKKFMIKNFQQLLVSIAPLSMPEQKHEIEKTFNEWKGHRDQIDDVTIIGLKV